MVNISSHFPFMLPLSTLCEPWDHLLYNGKQSRVLPDEEACRWFVRSTGVYLRQLPSPVLQQYQLSIASSYYNSHQLCSTVAVPTLDRVHLLQQPPTPVPANHASTSLPQSRAFTMMI